MIIDKEKKCNLKKKPWNILVSLNNMRSWYAIKERNHTKPVHVNDVARLPCLKLYLVDLYEFYVTVIPFYCDIDYHILFQNEMQNTLTC